MEVSLEGFEHLLFAEVVDGVVAGGGAEAIAEGGICDELCGGGYESGLGCGVGWDGEAARFVRWRLARHAAGDNAGDLGAGIGDGEDGAAAGEHAGGFGGHERGGGGGGEEVGEAGEGLERQEGDVGAAGDEGLELRAEGSISAEEEVDSGI